MHISPIKPILAAAVLLAFIPAAFAQSGRVQPTPTPTPPDEIVKVATEEIKLNVLAFNVSGAFVPDMTLDDLVIAENNVLHPPSSVRRIPANVLIVMDTGGEMRVAKSLDRTRRVAIAVAEALRDGDQVAVMQYSDRAEVISEWTTNRAETVAAIKRSNFGRRSVFVDAITAARQFMIASGADNRHIVLITDGTDSLGRSSAKFDALQALTATDISVHVLSYTSMEIDDIEPLTRRFEISATQSTARRGSRSAAQRSSRCSNGSKGCDDQHRPCVHQIDESPKGRSRKVAGAARKTRREYERHVHPA